MCPRKPAVDQERPRHLPASNRVKEFSACAPGGGFPLLGGPRALNPARPRSLSQVRHEVKQKDDLRCGAAICALMSTRPNLPLRIKAKDAELRCRSRQEARATKLP